jgi:hypothetical protein
MSGVVHPDQNVRNATQNSLCRAVNRRRGCCACRASNCRRRARFSRTRSSRERKPLTNLGNVGATRYRAGIISEKSESSFAPSHSFCRCTTLWRGTTLSPALLQSEEAREEVQQQREKLYVEIKRHRAKGHQGKPCPAVQRFPFFLAQPGLVSDTDYVATPGESFRKRRLKQVC